MTTSTILEAPEAHPRSDRTRRRAGRAPRLLATAAGAALGLAAVTAAPAWAHDELLSATPEADEVLTESPEEIVLEFTGDGLTEGENITNQIRVTDGDGESWETETVVDGPSMSTELDGELPDGEYEVLYRVVYSDGHDEEDSFSFEVDLPEDAAETDGAETDAADADSGETGSVDADAASQEDPATAEGQFPAWAAVLFALGGVLVVILAVVLMRRKMTQVEDWKKAPRQPRDTSGSAGAAGEQSGDDRSDEGDDRPRDDTRE
ncbi:copper resistance CopC family protein [Nesterenkonia sp. K-15-9-6]|uniref:copper resistance CopC family protein n=1 Tax=Nesterenkonia sp. K-15-9-6 TaxID=3093918 RepID=UPI0040442EF4